MKQLPPTGLKGRTSGAVWAILLLVLGLLSAHSADTSNRSESPQPPGKLIFSHASGFYESTFSLTLSTSVDGATIYFTTNGTVPQPANAFRYQAGIPISTTTIVRAAAFRGNSALTDVTVRAYLFITAILKQSGEQLPQAWGTNLGQPIPAHYAMSATLIADSTSREAVAEGLRSLPTLSIATDPENLFSASTGIYLHPLERGADWVRPATVEYFDARGGDHFQINCGLRIHGGMSRRPEESPKHSLRLSFQRRYGAAKLSFPVFGTNGIQEFDELILRAGGSDSWLESNGDRRRQATYFRDEWMRQSLRAMGHPSARGKFVQVYLNGLYWGVYNLCERPVSLPKNADASAVLPDYDVRNADKTESGDRVVWDKVMALANSGLSDASRYQALGQSVDLTELADYLILNFYAGNADWDRSANWYAIRPRVVDGRFQFLVWDAERTFGEVVVNALDLDNDESPMRLFHKLSENSTFRALFAARAQRLLYADGPLAPGPAAERFRSLADSIAPALVAEAARWGNYRAEVYQYKTGPYKTCTVKEEWRPEVNRILSGYFPQRREILLDQFRERGLFSTTNRPPEK